MSEDKLLETPVNRRKLLLGAGGVALAAAAGNAVAGSGHHHHHQKTTYGDLAKATHECSHSGEICISHCNEMFIAGDTSLAKCSASVQEMIAACSATATLANLGSANIKPMAAACKAICEDCREECKKHGDDHAQCKDCADACTAVIEECDKLIG